MNKKKRKKIAIIGGGIGGLLVGYYLKKKNYSVDIFEKEEKLGGLLQDFEIDNFRLEKTYHHIFAGDSEVIKLISELGLSDKLIWKKENNAIFYKNNLYAFNTPIDLLNFWPLNLIDKIRVALVTFYLQYENNYKKFEGIKAYQWLEKYYGKNIYEVMWKPLLKNKFEQYYKEIEMPWFWARVHFRGHSKLGYLEGGFGQIIDKLSVGLKIVHKKVEIDNLKNYDLIIDTSPIKSVKYIGAIDVVFTSKQNLSKFYWHNINDENAPFVAFIQHTNLTDGQGKNVYYMGGYYPHEHKYFNISDEEIYKEFFEYLKKVFPSFEEKEIEKKYIFKFKYAQHVPRFAGNSKIQIPRNKQVVHMNFAQIYPQDRGINYAVRMAKEVVASLP